MLWSHPDVSHMHGREKIDRRVFPSKNWIFDTIYVAKARDTADGRHTRRRRGHTYKLRNGCNRHHRIWQSYFTDHGNSLLRLHRSAPPCAPRLSHRRRNRNRRLLTASPPPVTHLIQVSIGYPMQQQHRRARRQTQSQWWRRYKRRYNIRLWLWMAIR